MTGKLNLMDQFPELTLTTTDDRALQIPADLDSDYLIVLFYRGHW